MGIKPHILIIEARFYDELADDLHRGVTEVLEQADVTFETMRVSGALEIPAAIKFAAATDKFDGYVALGVVLRGETYHFEVVSNESARGLMDLALQDNLVIGNGILTCETREQVVERADPGKKNKGGEAARAMLSLLKIKENLGLLPLE